MNLIVQFNRISLVRCFFASLPSNPIRLLSHVPILQMGEEVESLSTKGSWELKQLLVMLPWTVPFDAAIGGRSHLHALSHGYLLYFISGARAAR